MANKLKVFNSDMRFMQVENDDCEKNMVRRNNLETTFNLLRPTTKTSSSTQNICLTISPHPTSTYTISPQMPAIYLINPNNFQVTMMSNIHPPTIVFPCNENKHNQLAPCLYSRHEKNIQSICHKDLEKELHNLRKDFDEELRSRNYQKIENGIQGGRIVSNSVAKVVQQTFQAKIPVNMQSKMRENNSIFMTMQQPQRYPSDQFFQSHATSNYCNARL
ncbi:hypothetical protein H5410_037629 [Solanum commersonii]|uniref:Uncharacterized protein n=1 Tax=Solanum commersonii TaxID=4109 RepID=A0A9J5Y8E3_SOLCO|nr:hypothetical protein H5410_037629 [Solanum commersonii]